MTILLQKINRLSPISLFFFLVLFFLPMQPRYTKWLKSFSERLFNYQSFPEFFDHKLWFSIGDILLIALICFAFSHRLFAYQKSHKYLLAFLVIALLSILTSQHGAHLWPYLRLLQFSLPIALYFILTNYDGRSLVKASLWILFFASLFQCSIALMQYFSQHSLGLKGLGETKINFLSPNFYFPKKSLWIFGTQAPRAHIIRAFGTLPHPNILGGFMGLALFSAFFLFQETKGWMKRAISLGIFLQFFVIFLTFSRGALFGVIGASLFYFLFYLRKHSTPLLLLLLFSICFSVGSLYEQILHRGGIIRQTEHSMGSDRDRLEFQNIAINLAKKRPLLGQGFGQYAVNSEHDSQIVHNIYLLILAEMGPLGLLAFLGFCCSLIYWTLKSQIDHSKAILLTMFLFILWFGCVDHYWLTSSQGRLMLFTVAGLLASSALAKDRKALRSSRDLG